MICLTPEEIEQITGRKRYSAQRIALNMMGIDYKTRPDGSVVVFRNTTLPISPIPKRTEPDWEAIR